MSSTPLPAPTLLDLSNASAQQLIDAQAALFTMLSQREKEFGFNPHIIIEYPNSIADFLNEPIAYLETCISAIQTTHNKFIKEIIILTTYGDRLINTLGLHDYVAEKINMPAGPEHTFKFSKVLREIHPPSDHLACTLYVEAVNEQDEKIRPTFILNVYDTQGALCGGMSGSIAHIESKKYAYIATVVTHAHAPKLTGSHITQAALMYFKKMGVKQVDLGTQTADRFYEKQGFHISHTILSKLRNRVGKEGHLIHHDLVIMRKELS